MPWYEVSPMLQREHFYNLWLTEAHSVSSLCELFGISRKTGYKWIARGKTGQAGCFGDRSRRPHHSPNQTDLQMERAVVAMRKRYPDWNGRKLKKLLEDGGHSGVPAASTITEILRRHGLLTERGVTRKDCIRFEHEYPNALWQMDFKGHFALSRGRCHPLTVLDDHSRFNLVLKACTQETREVVQYALQGAFERHGLPDRMCMDNGSPWGNKWPGRYTKLTVWLMDLDIRVLHSRPGHPQTQGKDERFHRTLKQELIRKRHFCNMRDCQRAFDAWQARYNYVRPHEALSLEVPAMRYRVSPRKYREWSEEFKYDDHSILRKVNRSGAFSYRLEHCFIGEAFAGRWVEIKPTVLGDTFDVYYRHQPITQLILNR